MQIRISVPADESGVTVRDLYRWLRLDDDVRRHGEVQLVPAEHVSGTMGAIEVIDLVLGQAIAALNLALAYAAWRSARPEAPPVTVSVDGVSVTVRDGSEESVQRIVSVLRSLPSAEAAVQHDPGTE
ncbi:effector-associated constant component EACC1 [Streptomyces chartreusis]|uniref:Uncharacterized protein n=1 Tax=Streptomyces chartreusis TaxID=1969 RepID=A0A7H8TK83_STRCX|nr:hypothetical protein [Streptomyces chartreusis]QKZ23936.1 hypothetical protein HUT05_45240 [Streptomyces chartreusis]